MIDLRPLSTVACQTILENNILPYWQKKMIDEEHGGFYGQIDGNDNIVAKADKGVILNTRILWTFSSAYLNTKDPVYQQTADRAYEYLKTHFIDEENGGVYWMLNHEGNPKETKKQVYAQAFAIYALAEYYKITEDKDVLMLAIELYNLLEEYSLDKEFGGYLEAFDKDWNLLEDLRLSDKDQNEAKTMNTHLHVLEAYTNLFRVWQDEKFEASLASLIELFMEKFVRHDGHFHLFFDEKWNLKSEDFSYGHDIEGGWLLHEATEVLGNETLRKRAEAFAINMTNAALEGLDSDGGLMNEGNAAGVHDRTKHWWPQAEALVGLVNAYQITEDEKFLETARQVWNFIQVKIIDHVNGEWHWMVDADGVVSTDEDKAGPWKCPYHNGRAMMELMQRLKLKSF